MSVPDHDAAEQIEWQGKYLTAKTRGRWEYVGRARDIRAAMVLAIDDGHVLLVEQYRVPLGCQSIELPAGLIGDDESAKDEDVLVAAGRELEEETGYRARELVDAGAFNASPGMVSESFSLVIARGLERVGQGGGTVNEDITVHRVPIVGFADFITAQRALGKGIDARLLLLLSPAILAQAQQDIGSQQDY
ncbi:NUDIX hydrolase [Croceicoccus sp. F390]|uniref:GDP-mannose pyrophosphatase n=1 Tax=Croceicoccus esteveae TaxID=3075597 RepID=A0ABU2ZFL9_9SPHN|nr:NUDIX hydrolase [Croceicoccus sp. F390]MDT0575393.1 NUDIX hydrolase [Croceicoccus sp. F390]